MANQSSHFHPRAAAFAEGICNALQVLDGAVESRPNVLAGTLVLKGTRLSIGQIFAELAEGESVDTIATEFEVDRATLSSILHGLAIVLTDPGPSSTSKL